MVQLLALGDIENLKSKNSKKSSQAKHLVGHIHPYIQLYIIVLFLIMSSSGIASSSVAGTGSNAAGSGHGQSQSLYSCLWRTSPFKTALQAPKSRRFICCDWIAMGILLLVIAWYAGTRLSEFESRDPTSHLWVVESETLRSTFQTTADIPKEAFSLEFYVIAIADSGGSPPAVQYTYGYNQDIATCNVLDNEAVYNFSNAQCNPTYHAGNIVMATEACATIRVCHSRMSGGSEVSRSYYDGTSIFLPPVSTTRLQIIPINKYIQGEDFEAAQGFYSSIVHSPGISGPARWDLTVGFSVEYNEDTGVLLRRPFQSNLVPYTLNSFDWSVPGVPTNAALVRIGITDSVQVFASTLDGTLWDQFAAIGGALSLTFTILRVIMMCISSQDPAVKAAQSDHRQRVQLATIKTEATGLGPRESIPDSQMSM
jgi:hypothetical protein